MSHERTTASMRPRVFPAEDSDAQREVDGLLASFNEAAGIPRGRRRATGPGPWLPRLASMRPRVFPAEDAERRETRIAIDRLQ